MLALSTYYIGQEALEYIARTEVLVLVVGRSLPMAVFLLLYSLITRVGRKRESFVCTYLLFRLSRTSHCTTIENSFHILTLLTSSSPLPKRTYITSPVLSSRAERGEREKRAEPFFFFFFALCYIYIYICR